MQCAVVATSVLHILRILHHECTTEGHLHSQLWEDLWMVWNSSTQEVRTTETVRFYGKYIKDLGPHEGWAMTLTFLGAAENAQDVLSGSNLKERVMILQEWTTMLLYKERSHNTVNSTQIDGVGSRVGTILLDCRAKVIQNMPEQLPRLLAPMEGLDPNNVSDGLSSETDGSSNHTRDTYPDIESQCFICARYYNFPEDLLTELDDCIKTGEQATKAWVSQIVGIVGDPNSNIRSVRTICGHIMCDTVSWAFHIPITWYNVE